MNTLRLEIGWWFLKIGGTYFCKKIQTVAVQEKYLYLEIQRKSTLSNVFIAKHFSASLFTALVNRGFTFAADLSWNWIIIFILYVRLVKCKDWSREMSHWVKCWKIKLLILHETKPLQSNCSHQEGYGL